MDLDAFRMILSNLRVNVWELIETAITVASLDYGHQLKDRRNRIMERLYTTTSSDLQCQNCDVDLQRPNSSEESQVELLQSLADMDITFKALKEADIGRHVNRLRKNPSNDVRRLVKQLVRKWKDLVDE
ncbi:probable mediator of RNA polymerase II transcription subunit 26c [Camellia sinensis]|uniref:probable mediator of RNA polymerase II transcription subunit 26c n=1 Tax=Camellia sinensis TaxID=4442 RepID=UPI001036A234|nr:probable mediator of RNA polymerase II transcription subunit 26c [Camellia sinensis]